MRSDPDQFGLAEWSDPNQFQLKALHEALLFAYPRPADLNMLLQFGLGKSYHGIAPVGENYSNALLIILIDAKGAGWLSKLVQEALKDKPQSPKLVSLNRSYPITEVEVPAALQKSLEDIVRADGEYQDLIPWVQKLEDLAWKTCRIEYPVNTARGTGWLVGPDRLLTNWHVINRALPGGTWDAKQFVCRFDYATTANGTQPGVEVGLADDWCIDASPPSTSELGTGTDDPSAETLDYALLRLEKAVGEENTPAGDKRDWVKIKADQPLPQKKEIVLVVQHPDGLPVMLAIGDVDDASADKARIFHTANTKGGASGSVVVNAKLEPIGLHHAGDLLYNTGKIGKPEKNQAVPIGIIVARLVKNGHWT